VIAPRPRLADNVLQHVRFMRAHGLDFTAAIAQRLERPHSRQRVAVPGCVEADLRCLQARQVEREHIPRRRICVHAIEVNTQQVQHARITEITRDNLHPSASATRPHFGDEGISLGDARADQRGHEQIPPCFRPVLPRSALRVQTQPPDPSMNLP